MILATLEPLWKRAPVTASRVAQRIAAVLDYATAHYWRTGDNPAARKLIEFAMPKATVGKEHHPAMPYAAVPAFMAELRAREGLSVRLLEMTILTACRAGEIRNARWDEIDLEARTLTIPASRMKNRKPHTIPLCDRALAILECLPRVNDHLFPGRGNAAVSEMGVRKLIEAMAPDYTLHGMRSTFRDWCGDETTFPREIAEAALAHTIGNAVEAAYRRGSALEQRRRLMTNWASYCEQPPAEPRGNVVLIGAKRG